MPAEVLIAQASQQYRKNFETSCVVQAEAELVSLGGAVLLAICMVLTTVFLAAWISPTVTALQRAIALILGASSWVYLVNSVTEHLSLVGSEIIFRAALGRTHRVALSDLEAMILIHQGLNLERGMETIEFRRFEQKPETISLGPCWQRNKLEGFLHSVESVLRTPHLLEEVR